MSFTSVPGSAWLTGQDCDLDVFRSLVERTTDLADFPHASAVEGNVLVYDSARLRAAAGDGGRAIRAELVRAFSDGPGVVVGGGGGPAPRGGVRRGGGGDAGEAAPPPP
ncbi:phytanoyl-CoA dioxygenase family protein, partial [Streptomyces sp. NPDC002491]